MRLLFLLLMICPAAFSQEATEYVVLEMPAESIFLKTKTPKLQIDKNLSFKDTDRATKAYNNYLSKPVDQNYGLFDNCRYAYQVSAFDLVTNQVLHDIFPEVKW